MSTMTDAPRPPHAGPTTPAPVRLRVVRPARRARCARSPARVAGAADPARPARGLPGLARRGARARDRPGRRLRRHRAARHPHADPHRGRSAPATPCGAIAGELAARRRGPRDGRPDRAAQRARHRDGPVRPAPARPADGVVRPPNFHQPLRPRLVGRGRRGAGPVAPPLAASGPPQRAARRPPTGRGTSSARRHPVPATERPRGAGRGAGRRGSGR